MLGFNCALQGVVGLFYFLCCFLSIPSGDCCGGRAAGRRFLSRSDGALTRKYFDGKVTTVKESAGKRFLKTFMFIGEIPERSKGADCKSVGSAFVGSNPSLPKIDMF